LGRTIRAYPESGRQDTDDENLKVCGTEKVENWSEFAKKKEDDRTDEVG